MTWNDELPGSVDAATQSAAMETTLARESVDRPVADLGRELDALNERLRRSQERMRELLERRRADGVDGMTAPAVHTVLIRSAAPAGPTPALHEDPFGGRVPSDVSSAGVSHDPFSGAQASGGPTRQLAEDSAFVIDLREVPTEPSPLGEPDVWGGSRSKSALRVGATSMTWATPGPLVADPIWGPPTTETSSAGWTTEVKAPSPADQVWSPPPPGPGIPPPPPDMSPRQDLSWGTEDLTVPVRPAPASVRDDEDRRPADVASGTTRPGWQSNLITLMVALVVLVVALVFVGAI